MNGEEARRQQIAASRERLLSVLGDIAEAVAQQSLVRCPYRTRQDVCTFRGECRNQLVAQRARRRCAGGTLQVAPPTAAELLQVWP